MQESAEESSSSWISYPWVEEDEEEDCGERFIIVCLFLQWTTRHFIERTRKKDEEGGNRIDDVQGWGEGAKEKLHPRWFIVMLLLNCQALQRYFQFFSSSVLLLVFIIVVSSFAFVLWFNWNIKDSSIRQDNPPRRSFIRWLPLSRSLSLSAFDSKSYFSDISFIWAPLVIRFCGFESLVDFICGLVSN